MRDNQLRHNSKVNLLGSVFENTGISQLDRQSKLFSHLRNGKHLSVINFLYTEKKKYTRLNTEL